MAKSNLPSVDDHEVPRMAKAVGIAAADSVSQSDGTHLVEIAMNSSVGQPEDEVGDHGYMDSLMCYRAIDTRLPKSYHRIAFRNKLRHLIDTGAILKDGTPVAAKTDVLKWFLENCV